MNLFLLRHGKAHARSHKWRPDSRRPLTRDGEVQMFAVARGMRALGLSFDAILSSPFARALRTAEILAAVYETPKLIETPLLAPEAAPEDIIDELNNNFTRARSVVLVGHEPFLSNLISTLVSGSAGLPVDLKKAGLCKLSVEKLAYARCARLRWLMPPKPLARLRWLMPPKPLARLGKRRRE